MAVYVDSMRAQYRGMICCHMAADTHDELMAMAQRLGLDPAWLQHAGTHREHFDIALSKRKIAVAYGAQEVSMKELMLMMGRKREEA
jgi:hypothetical protein